MHLWEITKVTEILAICSPHCELSPLFIMSGLQQENAKFYKYCMKTDKKTIGI